LSDPLRAWTRLNVVTVSHPEEVIVVLLKVASAHAEVLPEPQPEALFVNSLRIPAFACKFVP